MLRFSVPQGGVESRNLYHNYIMVWVQDMQLCLLDLCKAEKVPWAGVITNYSTSPFAEELYDKIKEMLSDYEVVINRWPQYTLILENVSYNDLCFTSKHKKCIIFILNVFVFTTERPLQMWKEQS